MKSEQGQCSLSKSSVVYDGNVHHCIIVHHAQFLHDQSFSHALWG